MDDWHQDFKMSKLHQVNEFQKERKQGGLQAAREKAAGWVDQKKRDLFPAVY